MNTFTTTPSIQDFIDTVTSDTTVSDTDKQIFNQNMENLKNAKVNILITGATGSGKSSTINALFNADRAVVGQSPNPETVNISKYELNNIVLYDTPGLGDGKEADIKHAKAIVELLHQCDEHGDYLIDLVLVILDGGSRDLGTSFELINQVIIPNLGSDTKRLLIAINQADMAMKGRYWNAELNQPEPTLIQFLNDKVDSTRDRIKEATGVDTSPIYFSAGYKDGLQSQNPYNLAKLLLQILTSVKTEKRVALGSQVNPDDNMWKDNDDLKDYQKEIKKTMLDSIKENAGRGADIGASIGRALAGPVGEALGKVGGAVVGGIVGFFSSWF